MDNFNLIAAGNWVEVVVAIVAIVAWALKWLLSENDNAPKQRTPPRRPANPPRPPEQRNAPVAADAQLNAEIEKFLRRTNERRGAQPRREAPRAEATPRQPSSRRPAPEQPSNVGTLERRELSTVAQSVEEHLADRGFKQRAEHLADDIVRADQQMEQHLQQAFGHHVGRLTGSNPERSAALTDTASAVVPSASMAAVDIVSLLASANSLRQAIVLNEILSRPEHRW